MLKSWHHFSVVLHWSPNDTTGAKQLPYYLEKNILMYAYKNRFLEIFPWPNFCLSKQCAYLVEYGIYRCPERAKTDCETSCFQGLATLRGSAVVPQSVLSL